MNARMLWEAGITYGYGTDTSFLPKDSLAQELRALRLVFSAQDIIKIMTRNAGAKLSGRWNPASWPIWSCWMAIQWQISKTC